MTEEELKRVENLCLPLSTIKAFLILYKAKILPDDDYPALPTITEVEFGFVDLENDNNASQIVRTVELFFNVLFRDPIRYVTAEVLCPTCCKKAFGVVACKDASHAYFIACSCGYKNRIDTHLFLDACPHIYQKLDRDNLKKDSA